MVVFQAGDKCRIIGLQRRHDLNGQIVTVLKWSKKHGRWEVRCSNPSLASVRVRPENLIGLSSDDAKKQFVACVSDCLDKIVRGGGVRFDDYQDFMHKYGVGSGQISNIAFSTAGITGKELFQGNDSDSIILAMLLECIGKNGDSKLIQESLKSKLDNIFENSLVPLQNVMSTFSNMISISDLGKLMLNLREGTLAFIESRRCFISKFVSDFKLASDLQQPNIVMGMMIGFKDDNKSLKSRNLGDEIFREAMGGEVTIIDSSGIKRVEVNESLHRIYIHWLFDDVAQTLSVSDASKGSLSKWHRILIWEKELTSSIQVTPGGREGRMRLDVSDDFAFGPWIEGLLSMDLDLLSGIPGVDTDRRILRMAFLSELTFQFLFQCGILDRKHAKASACTSTSPSSNSKCSSTNAKATITSDKKPNASDDAKSGNTKFKKGYKVFVLNLDNNGAEFVVNGMYGEILEQIDSHHYSVLFPNLAVPRALHASKLSKVKKVPRESHLCTCGKEGQFLCSRCGSMWYCSIKCQMNDKTRHGTICKSIASKWGFMDLAIRQRYESSDEEIDGCKPR